MAGMSSYLHFLVVKAQFIAYGKSVGLQTVQMASLWLYAWNKCTLTNRLREEETNTRIYAQKGVLRVRYRLYSDFRLEMD